MVVVVGASVVEAASVVVVAPAVPAGFAVGGAASEPPLEHDAPNTAMTATAAHAVEILPLDASRCIAAPYGSPDARTASHLYFCTAAGGVFRMPYDMADEWAAPEPVNR